MIVKKNASFVWAALISAVFLVAAAPIAANAADNTLPKGWFLSGSNPAGYDVGTEVVKGASGNSVFIKAKTTLPTGFATVMQMIAADNYRGQRLRLSALLKTAGADRAQLWMRMDGPDKEMLGFYNMDDRPVTGTTDWKRYDVVLDVPEKTVAIAFGFFLNGKGEVWANDFKLEGVAKVVPLSEMPSKHQLSKAPVNLNFAE